jgi:hypothetical protein
MLPVVDVVSSPFFVRIVSAPGPSTTTAAFTITDRCASRLRRLEDVHEIGASTSTLDANEPVETVVSPLPSEPTN